MRLSIKQVEALSKVFIDFGKIIFAALVVGNFLPKNLIIINYTLICIGLLISAISITFGMFLLKGVNDK
ncbi:MAG: hypothetical protein HQ551_09565 [Desulfobacteraceae bacterium]|nr:hypothetical protein [Desulfobacteraceae bacterium]